MYVIQYIRTEQWKEAESHTESMKVGKAIMTQGTSMRVVDWKGWWSHSHTMCRLVFSLQ